MTFVLQGLCLQVYVNVSMTVRKFAFGFVSRSGDTTLSASGFLVPCNIDIQKTGSCSPGHESNYETATSSEPSVVVITCASIVEPFLSPRSHGSALHEVCSRCCSSKFVYS